MQYKLVIFFIKAVMLLPAKLRLALFKFLGYLVYLLDAKHKRVIEINARHVYKDKLTPELLKTIQKGCFKYLFLNILTMIEAGSFDKERMRSRITFENREYIDTLLAQNKPIVIVTAHFGNIEILGYAIGQFLMHMVQVQRRVKDEKLTAFMKAQRQGYGLDIVEKKGAVRHLMRALKKKIPISLVADQNVWHDVGSRIKFLGEDAYQTNSPAFLARKFDAAIVPVFMSYDDDTHYRITFKEPFYVEKTDNEEQDIFDATQKQADIMSEEILKRPDHWFWCHKRFHGPTPEIYER